MQKLPEASDREEKEPSRQKEGISFSFSSNQRSDNI